MTTMINRGQTHTLKIAAFCFFFLIFLFFILRPSADQFTTTNQAAPLPVQVNVVDKPAGQCSSIPSSLSQTLIHYATSNITPQQTPKEISVTDRVLRRKSPCNFLVFGLGHDSPMWAALNHGGRTLFLEEDASWIQQIRSKFPDLLSLHLTYDTKVRHADGLLRSALASEACSAVVDPRESKCPLALKNLPAEVMEVEWDVIMVDAPTGYHEEAPGRMNAIYTAGLLGRIREVGGETDVMVHDSDRPVEDRFSKAFLCEGYLKEQEGRLRHFAVPSHKARPGRPFCPSLKS